MKKLTILSISVLIAFFAMEKTQAQTHWTFDMYETVTHKNFRSNKLFKQEFDASNPDIPLLDAAIFYATNEQRVKKRKSVMKYHKIAEIAAYNHSKMMVEKNFFSHTNSKVRSRKDPTSRIKLAGANVGAWAENIAYNYASDGDTYLDIADKLIDQWMHSRGHKKNILHKENVYLGCGAYMKGDAVYATQVFFRVQNVRETKATDKLPPLKN